MIFYGEPNILITDGNSKDNKPLFKFDENGMAAIEDPLLIQRLKIHFKYDEVYEAETKEETQQNESQEELTPKRRGRQRTVR